MQTERPLDFIFLVCLSPKLRVQHFPGMWEQGLSTLGQEGSGTAFLNGRGVDYLFCILAFKIKFFEQRIALKGLKNHYFRVSCFLLLSFYQFIISVSFFCVLGQCFSKCCLNAPLCLLKMQTSGTFVHWASISEKGAQDSASFIIRPGEFDIKVKTINACIALLRGKRMIK